MSACHTQTDMHDSSPTTRGTPIASTTRIESAERRGSLGIYDSARHESHRVRIAPHVLPEYEVHGRYAYSEPTRVRELERIQGRVRIRVGRPGSQGLFHKRFALTRFHIKDVATNIDARAATVAIRPPIVVT